MEIVTVEFDSKFEGLNIVVEKSNCIVVYESFLRIFVRASLAVCEDLLIKKVHHLSFAPRDRNTARTNLIFDVRVDAPPRIIAADSIEQCVFSFLF